MGYVAVDGGVLVMWSWLIILSYGDWMVVSGVFDCQVCVGDGVLLWAAGLWRKDDSNSVLFSIALSVFGVVGRLVPGCFVFGVVPGERVRVGVVWRRMRRLGLIGDA
jgi:hypothetical protein